MAADEPRSADTDTDTELHTDVETDMDTGTDTEMIPHEQDSDAVRRTLELPPLPPPSPGTGPAGAPDRIGQVPTGLSRHHALQQIQAPPPAFWQPPGTTQAPGVAQPPQAPAPQAMQAPPARPAQPAPPPAPPAHPAPPPAQPAVSVPPAQVPSQQPPGARPGLATPRNLLLGAVALVAVLAVAAGLVLFGGGDDAPQKPPAASGQEQQVTTLKATISSLDPSPGGSGFRERNGGWVTERYNSRDFGNLKDGVGLELDLGVAHTVDSIRFDAGNGPLTVELQAGDSAGSLSGYTAVGSPESASGSATLSGKDGGKHRYWLIWVTQLGQDNIARISDLTVTGL